MYRVPDQHAEPRPSAASLRAAELAWHAEAAELDDRAAALRFAASVALAAGSPDDILPERRP